MGCFKRDKIFGIFCLVGSFLNHPNQISMKSTRVASKSFYCDNIFRTMGLLGYSLPLQNMLGHFLATSLKQWTRKMAGHLFYTSLQEAVVGITRESNVTSRSGTEKKRTNDAIALRNATSARGHYPA